MANDWPERVSRLSPRTQPSDNRLYGHTDGTDDGPDHRTDLVSPGTDPTLGDLAVHRSPNARVDLDRHYSDPDPGPTKRNRLVAAGDRPADIYKPVVSKGAANYQHFPVYMDDVIAVEVEYRR